MIGLWRNQINGPTFVVTQHNTTQHTTHIRVSKCLIQHHEVQQDTNFYEVQWSRFHYSAKNRDIRVKDPVFLIDSRFSNPVSRYQLRLPHTSPANFLVQANTKHSQHGINISQQNSCFQHVCRQTRYHCHTPIYLQHLSGGVQEQWTTKRAYAEWLAVSIGSYTVANLVLMKIQSL